MSVQFFLCYSTTFGRIRNGPCDRWCAEDHEEDPNICQNMSHPPPGAGTGRHPSKRVLQLRPPRIARSHASPQHRRKPERDVGYVSMHFKVQIQTKMFHLLVHHGFRFRNSLSTYECWWMTSIYQYDSWFMIHCTWNRWKTRPPRPGADSRSLLVVHEGLDPYGAWPCYVVNENCNESGPSILNTEEQFSNYSHYMSLHVTSAVKCSEVGSIFVGGNFHEILHSQVPRPVRGKIFEKTWRPKVDLPRRTSTESIIENEMMRCIKVIKDTCRL